MSKNILYVKGMQISDSEEEEEVVDVWDEMSLNLAYDAAVKYTNVGIAKRIALATNKIDKNSEDINPQNKSLSKPTVAKNKYSSEKWKPGMHCRAIYESDGLEYEAIVLSIIDDSECVIKFLGYDESVVVPLKLLKSSHGKKERDIQIKSADVQNGYEQMSNGMEHDFAENSESSVNHNRERKKRKISKKKNISQTHLNGFKLPDMPVPLPNFDMKNMGSMELPLPPPPPPPNFFSGRQDTEDNQALSSMLLSWYMSGYYTGLYQGLSRKKEQLKQSM